MGRLRINYGLILLSLIASASVLLLKGQFVAANGLVRIAALLFGILATAFVWSVNLDPDEADFDRQLGHLKAQRLIILLFLVAGVVLSCQWLLYFDRFENPRLLNPVFNILNTALCGAAVLVFLISGVKSLFSGRGGKVSSESPPAEPADEQDQPENSQTATS
jgi:glucan phosphoethanolaminetransferase (alkaline phosphatase superfamily)